MKRNALMIVIVLTIAVPALAQHTVWIPIAAHTPGVGTSMWKTDLGILNECAGSVAVEVVLQRSAGLASRTFTVNFREHLKLGDVIAQLIDGNTSGSLEIRSDNPVSVTSRTYNEAPEGTFGQSLPAIEIGDGLAAGESATLQHLSETSAFRTNIGVVNMGPTQAVVTFALFDPLGGFVGSFEVTVQAGQVIQDGAPYRERFGRSNIDGGWAQVSVTSGSGVWAYASVVDNGTGDPTTIAMQGRKCVAAEEITITLPGGVPMDLVHIPAGTFEMGSPTDERGRSDKEDLHQVTLTQGYYFGKYEVTQAQWQAVMGTNPAHDYGVGDNYPVNHVSWDDICGGSTGSDCLGESFIGRLNTYLGTNAFRMPTEAEWERAARAGTQTAFSFDTSTNPDWDTVCGAFPEAEDYMWWCGNNDPYGTKPVGSKLPNPYGLYDMHGNVYEWVGDWHETHLGTDPDQNPTGPASGSYRVARGGYWSHYARGCRSAGRSHKTPSYRSFVYGFRLARSE